MIAKEPPRDSQDIARPFPDTGAVTFPSAVAASVDLAAQVLDRGLSVAQRLSPDLWHAQRVRPPATGQLGGVALHRTERGITRDPPRCRRSNRERTTGTQDQRATTGVHPTGKTPQRHKYRQRTPRIRVRRGTSQLEPLSANVVAGSMFRSRPPAHTWLSNCYRQTRAISLAIQTAIQTVCVLWEHAILSAKGMLGTTREFRRGRGLLAVCLAAFFSLASLVPIAAQSLNDASGDMPCCKTKGKCCCRKNRNANSSRGPSIAATGCSDCGTVDLGSVSAKGNVPVRLLVLTPVVDAAITVAVATVLPPSRTFAHSLRQRPPPPEPLA